MPDSVSDWFRQRSLPARVGIYAAIAMVAFLLSTSVGALGAVMLGSDLALPGRLEVWPFDGREDASEPQVKQAGTSKRDAREEPGQVGIGQGDNGAASAGMPLWEALRECEQSQEDCARDFVVGVAPGAEYAGGRIDTDDAGRTRTILYFVDPEKAPCEYRRYESAAVGDDGSYYAVLIAGKGSFGQQQPGDGEAGCLPEL